MEGIPKQTAENDAKNAPNFHEISEKRKELRKAIGELGDNQVIFEKHYKNPLKEAGQEAGGFKVENFGNLSVAKEALRKQKSEYEKEVLENGADIDYETIFKNTPELGEVQKVMENIADLKDFRMRRMFEILNSQTSLPAKKRNEAVLKTIKEEIKENEENLEQTDPLILRQAKLLEYKENLAQSGHICVTPSAEKYLEAIGDRMLTGKPVFLHGPTGTGKTSLAKFAAKHFTGKDPEMVPCNPQTKESNVWGKTGIKPVKGGAIETVVENETRGIVNSFMRSFGPPWEVRNAFGLFGSSCRITRVKGSVSEGGGFYVEDYTGRVAVTNSREVTKHFKESDSDIKAVHFYFNFIDTRTYPFVRRYFEPCLDITHLHLDRDGGVGEDHGGTPLSREVEEFLNDAFPQDGSVEKPVLEELLM